MQELLKGGIKEQSMALNTFVEGLNKIMKNTPKQILVLTLLALSSLNGQGVETNAEVLYQRGNDYASGHGVPKNESEAVICWRKAAEQGYAPAQMTYGCVYAAGKTVVKNEAEATKWWRCAADQNNAEAQYALGLAYFLGKGVREDRVMAYMWCNLAASQDFQKAADLRDNIAKGMSSQQISDAQKLSSEWKPRIKSL